MRRALLLTLLVGCHDARFITITATHLDSTATTLRVHAVEPDETHDFTLHGQGSATFTIQVDKAHPSVTIVLQELRADCVIGSSGPTLVDADVEMLVAPMLGCNPSVDAGLLDGGIADAPVDSTDGAVVIDAMPPAPDASLAPRLIFPFNGGYAPTTPEFDWSYVAGATYELDLFECTSSPCTFGTPTKVFSVATTKYQTTAPLPVGTSPVGARYLWRVQACIGSTCATSEIRSVLVGRQPDDYNGDGKADIAAGDPGTALTLIWLGAGGGGADPTPQVNPPSTYGPLASGDVDGDGYADLAIGDPGRQQVLVFRGTPSGVSQTATYTLTVPGATSQFGDAVAVYDLDGDGHAEVIVGEPSIAKAVVHVFDGANLAATPRDLLAPTGAVGFGTAVGAGDVDDDGIGDIAVGAPASEANTGWVVYFPGNGGASTTLKDGAVSGDRLGGSLIVGDNDADHYAEIIAGAPTSSVGGTVHRWIGGPSGPSDSQVRSRLDNATTSSAGYGIGLTLAGGVLVVGAPYDGDGVVYEYAFPGGTQSCDGTTVACTNAQFGTALAAGDVDGDGIADVIVGAPGYTDTGLGGAVEVFEYAGGIHDLTVPGSMFLGTTVR